MKNPSAMLFVSIFTLALSACSSGDDGNIPGDADDTQPFSAIGEDEVINLNGTEPFWGGVIAGGVFTLRTAEQLNGQQIAVEAFAGRGGLSFSGEHDGEPLDLTVTQGTCSDGMSDVAYPFTATLRIGDMRRSGCGWSDEHPAIEP